MGRAVGTGCLFFLVGTFFQPQMRIRLQRLAGTAKSLGGLVLAPAINVQHDIDGFVFAN
jgi:hypothetical protein